MASKSRWQVPMLVVILAVGASCKGQGQASAGSMLDELAGREKRETKFENGQKKEEYSVVKDKSGNYVKDGPYVSFHQSGQKNEEGAFKADSSEGHWQKWDENGKLTLDLSFKAGKRDGKFTAYTAGAMTQSGSYLNDQLSGPFKYLGFDGLVVAGEMAGDAPTGAWSVTEAAGKTRARANFAAGKLQGSVQSLAADGSILGALPASGCADFGGYALGTLRWADVVFDVFGRQHAFPEDGGVNRFSEGRMLTLGGARLAGTNIEKMTLIFDRDDVLTALTATTRKQRGSDVSSDVIKQLHKEYSKKYTVLSASMPFVGDCHAEYRRDGCEILLDAPHLGFEMNVTLRSASFSKQFVAAR
jgi:antitoxin component YwqK of YwqJK toxin-antitoxin module